MPPTRQRHARASLAMFAGFLDPIGAFMAAASQGRRERSPWQRRTRGGRSSPGKTLRYYDRSAPRTKPRDPDPARLARAVASVNAPRRKAIPDPVPPNLAAALRRGSRKAKRSRRVDP